MKVKDKVIVVTGAGGGIGGALVEELLKRGAKVSAVDLRQDSLDALLTRLRSFKDRISIHPIDITNADQCINLPELVIKAQGQVDGLINCAGVIQPFVKVNDLEYKDIDKVMNINFYGTLYMLKAFLPQLLKRDVAHIVNISSMGGFLPVPGQSIYGASKAAVKLMSEGLYSELKEGPVRVSVVFPGATNTEITKNSKVEAPKASQKDVEKMSKNSTSPQVAAKTIVDGMEKDKLYILSGKDSKLMNRLYRLNPLFATNFIAKQMKSLLN